MCRHVFLFISALLSSFILWSQADDGSRYIKNAGEFSDDFEKITYYKKDVIPFRQIIVLDKRYDSSKTGYATTGFIQNYSRSTLKPSWSVILNNYFAKNLDSKSNQSLVIILRSYWLQKGVLQYLVNKKVVKTPLIGDIDDGGSCTAGMDIYVQTDTSLQALFRIDTFFINLASQYRKNNLDDFFFLPFDSIARRMASTSVPEVLAKKRKLSWQEVNNYYDQRFKLPVLKDAGIKRGIFRTFEEFRQNTPSISNFRFSNGRVTDDLYSIENGSEELIPNYWGFFDGKDLYIRAGLSSFKAVRQQNTFEVYGSKFVNNYNDNYGGQIDITVSGYTLDRKILQVNMADGTIY